MRTKLSRIVLLIALVAPLIGFAQGKKIDTVEFNVVTKYKPVITDAVKLNDNPQIADTVKLARKADYNNLVNTQFPTAYTPAAIDAIHMKGEPLDPLYHSQIAAGFGNYTTVYGEYFFNSLRSRDFDYGIHLNHLSSDATVDNKGYSGYGYNDVNLFGMAFIKNHTITVNADYDNHSVHDYGYDVNKDKINSNTTLQSFNYFDALVDYKSTLKDSSGINHDISVGYYDFSDVFNTSENNLDIKIHAFTYYAKQRIDIKASANYYEDNNRIQDTARTLNLQFNPYFTAIEKHWDARLGVKVFYDAINKFNVYPDFIGRYHVANDVLMIYAGVDGDKTFNSYKSLADMNPFIKDTITMHYSSTPIKVFAGIAGTITNDISYNLSGYESEINDMPLFVTDTNEILRNRFSVIYDNVRDINGHIDLSYRVREDLKFTLGADYDIYTPAAQLKVWYHPNLLVNLLGQYRIQQKYIVKLQLYVLGAQYAPVMNEGIITAKEISAYPDINLGFDYNYNHLFTAFINVNNIANISYQRWLNYPTQGFNVLAGVRLSF
jgi:hypothetical protein